MSPLSIVKTLLVVAAAVRSAAAATCNVAGGTADDAPAIKAALTACNNGGTVVLDKTYTIASMLTTTNLNNVNIQFSGTIKLNPDIAYWKANAFKLIYQDAVTSWLIGGTGIHIYGGGTFDGQGEPWYANGQTVGRPIPWTIYNAKNVLVENIKMIQAPFWHNLVYQSSAVTFQNIDIHAIRSNGAQAQNTDGWDIYRSDNVVIQNSHIVNGDDCVSFKPNSTNVVIKNLYCEGSHGISVGSLGQYAGIRDIVENVYIKNVTMVNASNGARIKAWAGNSSPTSTKGGGNGYVRNITFEDFTCQGCDHPVVIDQCYMTSSTCTTLPSKVLISDVHYIRVTGTGTKSKEVVSLVCSDICTNISATGTHLVGSSGSSEYFCTNIASLNLLDFPCSVAGSIVSGTVTKTSASKTSASKTSSTKATTTKMSTTTTKKTTTTKTTSTKKSTTS